MAYFTTDGLKVLAQQRLNSDRGRFTEDRPRYEDGLRAPMLRLVTDLGPGPHASSAAPFVAFICGALKRRF